MKFTSKQYASALYDAIEELGEEKSKEIIDKFVKLISNNQDFDKAKEIAFEFNKVWNEKNGVIEAEVISSHKLNGKLLEIFEDYIINSTGAKKILIEEKVDERILGGVIIKYQDKVLDASMRKELEDLNKELKR